MTGPDLARSPLVAVWELTGHEGHQPSSSRAAAVIEQLAELEPGGVVLTGTDLLQCPDLEAILASAVGRGLDVAVAAGRPAQLDADAMRRLADAGLGRIALHLDIPGAGVPDPPAGTPGSFATTRAASEMARAAGLALQLDTTVTAGTFVRVPEAARLAAALAPALWSVRFAVPVVGRGGGGAVLPPAACEAVFHLLYDWRAATGLAVDTVAAPAFRRVVVTRDARRRSGRRPRWPRPLPVNDGKGLLFVSCAGEVYPSGLLPLRAGNVGEDRLVDLYRRSRLFRALRDSWRLEGRCGACRFRDLCGGSRARAWAATGSFLAEDPACAFRSQCRDAAQPSAPA